MDEATVYDQALFAQTVSLDKGGRMTFEEYDATIEAVLPKVQRNQLAFQMAAFDVWLSRRGYTRWEQA
ncbi:MAG: hypothetical protein GF393_10615 [Armatimonadia bacterium]|nr:hypothetical protein [Armatimonadia bacterium]